MRHEGEAACVTCPSDELTAPEVARVEKAAIPLLRGKCLVLIDILLLERSYHPCDLLLRALVGILKALTAPTASTMQVDQRTVAMAMAVRKWG